MPKRFAGDGTLEAYYVRRVLNEVDICNHLGRWAVACRSRVPRALRLHSRQACSPACAHRQHTLARLWMWLAVSPRLHSPPRHLSAAHPALPVEGSVPCLPPQRRSLNVCYLYEVFEDDSCVDLVMELCSGGQLWDK